MSENQNLNIRDEMPQENTTSVSPQYEAQPPQVQNIGAVPPAPQQITPPHPNAQMVLGSDGRYYWAIPTAPTPPPQIVYQQQQVQPPIPNQPPYEAPAQNQAPQYNATVYQAPPVYIPAPPIEPPKPRIPEGFTEVTFAERKALRKQSFAIGWPLLCMLAIGSIVVALISVISMALFGDEDGIIKLLTAPVYNEVMQIVLSTFMFTVPFIIFAKKIGKQNLSEICGYNKTEKGTAFPMFLFGIAFCAFAQIAASVSSSIFESIDYNMPEIEKVPGIAGIVLSLLSTVVAPALVEEFACRGIILGSLRRFGDGFAIIVSSILFGVMHGNLYQIPFAFLVGLVLGYIRVKSGSIWICCVVHGFNNFVSVLMDTLEPYFTNYQLNIAYTIFLVVCMLLGLVALLFFKNRKEMFVLDKVQSESSLKDKYKWFFTSPLIIIFLVENLASSLIYFLPESFLSF